MKYNWQQPDWTNFDYDLQGIEDALFAFAEATGHITGILKGMPDGAQQEAIIDAMVAEAVKTSAIEGEFISRQDVVSSIRNKLGLNKKHVSVKDKKARGAAELMVDVRNSYEAPSPKKSYLNGIKCFYGKAVVSKQVSGAKVLNQCK